MGGGYRIFVLIVTLNGQTLKWQLIVTGNRNDGVRYDIYLRSCELRGATGGDHSSIGVPRISHGIPQPARSAASLPAGPGSVVNTNSTACPR